MFWGANQGQKPWYQGTRGDTSATPTFLRGHILKKKRFF